MVTTAAARGNIDLSSLEYKLFFFNWLSDPSYTIDQKVTYDLDQDKYFNKLEKELDTTITKGQRYWYAHQRSILGDKVKQEYPSTVSEAFLSTNEAYYFQACIEKAYNEHRMLDTDTYDSIMPVYIAMDIGVNDKTAITFFQCVHGEIRIIDYFEDSNQGVEYYANYLLQQKRYIYHTIFLPHDSRKRDGIVVENTYERDFKRYLEGKNIKILVLKQTDKQIQISNAKIKFDKCVFSLRKTKLLIDQLRKYRKKGSEQNGKYLDEPYHGVESNASDSFMYAMTAVNHITSLSALDGAYEKHKKVVDNRLNRL
jgi:hypothetical protein